MSDAAAPAWAKLTTMRPKGMMGVQAETCPETIKFVGVADDEMDGGFRLDFNEQRRLLKNHLVKEHTKSFAHNHSRPGGKHSRTE